VRRLLSLQLLFFCSLVELLIVHSYFCQKINVSQHCCAIDKIILKQRILLVNSNLCLLPGCCAYRQAVPRVQYHIQIKQQRCLLHSGAIQEGATSSAFCQTNKHGIDGKDLTYCKQKLGSGHGSRKQGLGRFLQDCAQRQQV
jgi:hypothetical protein